VNNGERRVVITGVGAVTPIGTGADGLWSGLAARRSAVREITRFDPAPFRSRIAAEIPDFRPHDHLDAKRAKRLDRFSQLAVTSARFALADAGLDPAREDRDRIGAMMGSALGGVAFAESQVARFYRDGPRGLDPALALAVFPGAASCDELRLGHHRRGGSTPRDPGRPGRRDARGRRRGTACADDLRGVQRDPRHEHAKRRSGARVAPVR
jgi:3-oxoacyl-(acyl-carrier-protein) synthase